MTTANWTIDPVLKAARSTKGIHKQCVALRERLGYTRAAFAEIMEYTEKRLEAMERAKRPTTLEVIQKLADLMKSTVRETYQIDPTKLAEADAITQRRKDAAAARAQPKPKLVRKEKVPTLATHGQDGAVYRSGLTGPALAAALDRLLGDALIHMLPPSIAGGAHLASARFSGRPQFAATGQTKGAALAEAIRLAQADLDAFNARRSAAE